MKRREVKILGLSYSASQTGSYVLVLSEKKGRAKLPIIIKQSEAQRIALDSEGIKSPRPLTHDLFMTFSDSYGVDIQEVYIHTLAEGIFYTSMLTSNGLDDIDIECSVGDGIILASLYKCPIFVSTSIINSAGVFMNDDGTTIEDDIDFGDINDYDDENEVKSVISIENLEKVLDEAIKNEEYEVAAKVRDRISELKGEQK